MQNYLYLCLTNYLMLCYLSYINFINSLIIIKLNWIKLLSMHSFYIALAII